LRHSKGAEEAGRRGDGRGPPDRHGARYVLGVAGLTLLAFWLRVDGIDQSLFGDELTLFNIVEHGVGLGSPPGTQGSGLGHVLDVVRDTEKTPPLGFILAWITGQLGDPTIWTRMPSLILGTAVVPVVYLIGSRTTGRAAALVAAAVIALAPFSIHYSVENRAYAALTFFSALSTLALLTALRRNRPLTWLAYGVSTAAVIYTHYTGVFVVVAQLGWALWTQRECVRQLVLVHAGVAVAFLPWLSSAQIQFDHSSTETQRLAEHFPLQIDTLARMVTGVLPGDPLGRSHEIAVWVTVGVALAAGLIGARRTRESSGGRSPTATLLPLLALATPVGIVLYSVQPDTSLLLPRNLSASLPAFALCLGWLLTSLRKPIAAAALGVVFLALVVGAARTLDLDYRRPPFRAAAEFIDRVAAPSDPVMANEGNYLRIYFDRPHRTFTIDDAGAWRKAARGRDAFLVRLQVGTASPLPRLGGPDQLVPLQGERSFTGRFPVAVGRYAGRVSGTLDRSGARSTISWSLGDMIPVSASAAHGFVDSASAADGRLTVMGWATKRERAEVADWVLAFRDRRLVAVGRFGTTRPDVARTHGEGTLNSGFTLAVPGAAARELASGRLRVLALAGNRASQLELTPDAQKRTAAGA
jgi:hypothetical protein